MTKPKANNRFADLLGAREDAQPEDTTSEPDAASTKGKRSNTDYVQVSGLVRKDTHKQVKAALIFDTENRDFSDLLEQLLQEWLAGLKEVR